MPLSKSRKTVAIITVAIALSGGLLSTDNCGLSNMTAGAKEEKEDPALNFAIQLSKGEFAKAHQVMNAAMQAAVPLAQLTTLWQNLNTQLGPFKALHPRQTEANGDLTKTIVEAEFEKACIDLQIASKDSRICGFFIAAHQAQSMEPTYADKENFQEYPVKIGSGKYQLDGTLTLPKGQGPFPAVILVHGSGPCDRDETIGAVKIFRDIAWGLASKEIAVLRYEKRTRQHGQAMLADDLADKITVKEETIDDALLAVELLARDKRIESNHIFILGHSLGGMLVPRMAKVSDTAAGFIIMAGATRPIEDMLLEQTEYLLSTSGKVGKKPIDGAGEKKQAALREQIKTVKDLKLSSNTASTKLPLGLPASYWLDLRNYKPAEAAKEIKKPILVLQGGKDYQITMVDFENWWNALNDKGNTTFKVYNGLNHGFVTSGNFSTAHDYDQPQNVSAEVITDISKWIKSQD